MVRKTPKNRKQEEGFTLILVSALLVVAAMIAASAMQKSKRDEYWNPRVDTEKKLLRIAEVLVAYQRENQELPCVARRNVLPTVSTHGQALDCSVAPVGGDSVRQGSGLNIIRIGTLPYKTLGLSASMSEDEWGNNFTYVVTEELTKGGTNYTNGVGAIDIGNGDNAIDGVTSVAAFAIISHGPDAKGAFRFNTSTRVKSCTLTAGRDRENCDDDATFYADTLNAQAGTDFYDDQVIWREVDSAAQNM